MAQVLRITKKIEKTITINDKEFVNKLIGFGSRSYWTGSEHKRYMLPNSRCFVHVWEKSNDLDDFLDNMERLFNVVMANCPLPLNYPLFGKQERVSTRQRATRYRSKGVNLQYFSRSASTSELNDIVDLSRGV